MASIRCCIHAIPCEYRDDAYSIYYIERIRSARPQSKRSRAQSASVDADKCIGGCNQFHANDLYVLCFCLTTCRPYSMKQQKQLRNDIEKDAIQVIARE